MLELRQLKAFVAIAEEGYITRAAERLGMQQPPLTRLLQSLEAELGVVLMERLPRGRASDHCGVGLAGRGTTYFGQRQWCGRHCAPRCPG